MSLLDAGYKDELTMGKSPLRRVRMLMIGVARNLYAEKGSEVEILPNLSLAFLYSMDTINVRFGENGTTSTSGYSRSYVTRNNVLPVVIRCE